MTVFDALVASIAKAADHTKDVEAAPVAILWPDLGRQWEPLLPRLRDELPLLTLGDHDPETRTGPAIWLRCMVDRTLPEADWPGDQIPIIYLPGVSCGELRQAADLPDAVKPLAELQYRGAVWRHYNGKDWTIAAFVGGQRGLDLQLAAESKALVDALRRALPMLAKQQVDVLRRHGEINVSYLNDLLTPDRSLAVLRWLNAPDAYRQSQLPEVWQAFRDSCVAGLDFNPNADGPVTDAQKLGGREGAWDGIWQRFAESPANYPNLPALLDQARPPKKPQGAFDFDAQPSSWPVENREQEDALAEKLRDLCGRDRQAISSALKQLEAEHGERRDWVWAGLGQAPLAKALVPLRALADGVAKPLGGSDVAAIAAHYAADGWRADAALVECLAAVNGIGDMRIVWDVADSLYRPWVEAAADVFQQAVEKQPQVLPTVPLLGEKVSQGECLVFADGLRMDVAQRLADRLRAVGCQATVEHGLAAFPTVTPTAKPAASPVAGKLSAGAGLDVLSPTGTTLNATSLRALIAEAGYTVLGEVESGDGQGRGWTETGRIDHLGHDQGPSMTELLGKELERMAARVLALLDAGWSSVRIVTDHGWLLLPEPLPKEELAEHRCAVRKGRCARMKSNENFEGRTVAWSWDPTVRIAVAAGIGCFTGTDCYAHGGLSPQECVTPRLTISRQGGGQVVRIEALEWAGLRCRVTVSGGAGLIVDIRSKAGVAEASVVFDGTPRACRADGTVSLPCHDQHEQAAVFVVVLNADGGIVAQRQTVVGGEG